jgi:beta-mannosidase
MEDGGNFTLTVANDGEACRAEFIVEAFSLDGESLWKTTFTAGLAENGVTIIPVNKPDMPASPAAFAVTDGFTVTPKIRDMTAMRAVYYVTAEVSGKVYESVYHPLRLRELPLQTPSFEIVEEELSIRIRSGVPAFGIFIETENDVGISKNGFDLKPGKWEKIEFSEKPGRIELFDLCSMRAEWV